MLGFARLHLPLDKFGPEMDDRYKEVEESIPHEGFCFIGNISLIDPPKAGVPDAVSSSSSSGSSSPHSASRRHRTDVWCRASGCCRCSAARTPASA